MQICNLVLSVFALLNALRPPPPRAVSQKLFFRAQREVQRERVSRTTCVSSETTRTMHYRQDETFYAAKLRTGPSE